MEQGLYEQTFKLIERAEQVICGPESSGLPMDLNVKAGEQGPGPGPGGCLPSSWCSRTMSSSRAGALP